MNVYEAAQSYLNFKINSLQYSQIANEDIRYLFLDSPIVVSTNDIINAITKFTSNDITLEQLVEWVNIIWFSDAFEFEEAYTDSIVSVIDQLECLDEDGVSFTQEQYEQMISCLTSNTEFPCLFT